MWLNKEKIKVSEALNLTAAIGVAFNGEVPKAWLQLLEVNKDELQPPTVKNEGDLIVKDGHKADTTVLNSIYEQRALARRRKS